MPDDSQAESRRAAAGAGLHPAGRRGPGRRSRSRSAAASAARPHPASAAAPSVRLALPRADLIQHELGRVRGEADKAALRIRHHDARLHRRFAPIGRDGGPALRPARGAARRGRGRREHGRASRPTSPAPIAPARASRRRASAARTRPWPRSSISTPASGCWASSLTPAQRKLMDELERVAGQPGGRGAAGPGRPASPTRRASRARSASFWPIWACRSSSTSRPRTATPRTSDQDDEQPPAGGDEDAQGDGEGEDQQQSAAQAERDERRRGRVRGRGHGRRQLRPEREPDRRRGRFRRGPAHQPAAVPAPRRRRPGLQGVRDPVRRGGHGRGAVRPVRAHPPARPARPVADPLPGHDRAHGQPAAAQADGAAAALLVVRPRRGHPRHRPPVAGRGQPRHLALVQDGGRDRVPRHGGQRC